MLRFAGMQGSVATYPKYKDKERRPFFTMHTDTNITVCVYPVYPPQLVDGVHVGGRGTHLHDRQLVAHARLKEFQHFTGTVT